MRKLTELLPIARSYLVTVEQPYRSPGESLRLYTCYSAELAYRDGEMARYEFDAIAAAICAELREQGFGGAIASAAQRAGVEDHDLRSPEYIAFRDSWLDTFHAKLQMQGL